MPLVVALEPACEAPARAGAADLQHRGAKPVLVRQQDTMRSGVGIALDLRRRCVLAEFCCQRRLDEVHRDAPLLHGRPEIASGEELDPRDARLAALAGL